MNTLKLFFIGLIIIVASLDSTNASDLNPGGVIDPASKDVLAPDGLSPCADKEEIQIDYTHPEGVKGSKLIHKLQWAHQEETKMDRIREAASNHIDQAREYSRISRDERIATNQGLKNAYTVLAFKEMVEAARLLDRRAIHFFYLVFKEGKFGIPQQPVRAGLYPYGYDAWAERDTELRGLPADLAQSAALKYAAFTKSGRPAITQAEDDANTAARTATKLSSLKTSTGSDSDLPQ